MHYYQRLGPLDRATASIRQQGDRLNPSPREKTIILTNVGPWCVSTYVIVYNEWKCWKHQNRNTNNRVNVTNKTVRTEHMGVAASAWLVITGGVFISDPGPWRQGSPGTTSTGWRSDTWWLHL